MTAPLMMIGPGGDYVTRYDVKGEGLIKTRTQQTAGHDRDAESSGNSAAWGWLPGRRNKQKQSKRTRAAADHYEHTEAPALPATYAKPGLADLKQQLAMLQAIDHWLTGQQDELDRLAAIQTATEADLAQAETASAVGSATPPAPIRVIRWNGGTMDLPTPAPDHTFASPVGVMADEEQPNPERSVSDDQPQPHPQADENFDADSRHPAIARLFADDARARRSLRRLKSHGLRARRSAHQKGLPDTRCEQGALFGAVA